jgi:TonB family protein
VPRVAIPAIPLIDAGATIASTSVVSSEWHGRGISESLGTSRGLNADSIYTGDAVERMVAPRHDNPRPDYPSQLRAAMVEGDVVVRFVVDTLGRVEPSSIVIVRATHPLFGDAVRRWLSRTRYAPAEVSGRRVRQLVQQPVGFTLRQ